MREGDTIVLAWLDEKPIGTVSYQLDKEKPEQGEIRRLAVLPAYRGNEYGQRLLEFAEACLVKMGGELYWIGNCSAI